MNIDEIVLILVRGLGQGAIFALIGMAFNVVVNSSGILNFANGMILMLAGVVTFLFLPAGAGATFWVTGLLLVVVATGLFTALLGALVLSPLKSSVEQHSWLITTMAISVIVAACIHIFGGSLAFRVPNPVAPIKIMGVKTPVSYFLLLVLEAIAFVGIVWFQKKTRVGLAMRAVAQDLDAAKAAGIAVKTVQLGAFCISGMILGATGFVGAPVISVSADAGIGYLLSGFTALVIGGLGSNVGAIVGGALVGVLSVYAAYNFGGVFQDTVTMALLIAVLMFRPEGLFGLASARKV